jgi:predicted RNase H-like HicB family nuclease
MKRAAQPQAFNLKVEFTRVKDGRWMAVIPDLPGVTACARTRKEALASAEELALQAIVDRHKRREAVPANRSRATAGVGWRPVALDPK